MELLGLPRSHFKNIADEDKTSQTNKLLGTMSSPRFAICDILPKIDIIVVPEQVSGSAA